MQRTTSLTRRRYNRVAARAPSRQASPSWRRTPQAPSATPWSAPHCWMSDVKAAARGWNVLSRIARRTSPVPAVASVTASRRLSMSVAGAPPTCATRFIDALRTSAERMAGLRNLRGTCTRMAPSQQGSCTACQEGSPAHMWRAQDLQHLPSRCANSAWAEMHLTARVHQLATPQRASKCSVPVRSLPTTAVPAQLTPVLTLSEAAGWLASNLLKPTPRRLAPLPASCEAQSSDPGATQAE